MVLPAIEPAEVYEQKAGPEILNQMYVFPDRKERSLCLRPEGTATCQLLAQGPWKQRKDVRIWYETRCWRYERPQAGRYREFTQFGVEVLNPTTDVRVELMELAKSMVASVTTKFEVADKIQRGLAYYIEDGFEISCPDLGAQKQVLGGGRYKEGIGFAAGVDRLMLLDGALAQSGERLLCKQEVKGAEPLRSTNSWRLMRQDDTGNVFEIVRDLEREQAEKLRQEFEARGHKQMYWIEDLGAHVP